MLLTEYQNNIIENCLVLFAVAIYRIMFIDLPGFNQPFLPVDMGGFLQKAPFENAKVQFNFVYFKIPLPTILRTQTKHTYDANGIELKSI